MELNQFVFPAPKPSYTNKDENLIFIPFILSEKKYSYEKEELLNSKIRIKASVLSQQPIHIQSVHKTTHHEIPCMLFNEDMLHKRVLIYFHANAEDIGMTKNLAQSVISQIQIAFLSVEYPGYGVYNGDCTSNQMIQDAHAVMKFVLKKCQQENIIIMGRSIGSGLAVELAARYHRLESLVLISPFTSLRDVVQEYTGSFLSRVIQERFRNLEKISHVQCPTLFIHGDQDEIVPIEHSRRLMNEVSGISYLERISGLDHNAFIFRIHITLPLEKFLLKLKYC